MSPSTDPSPPVVVFTDLDGCLLDGITYSWEPAREALEVLRARRIPLVLVSSKTRAELEAIRSQLQLDHPFVSENGGAVFSPDGYFSTSPEEAVRRDDYEVIELGTPYPTLRQALRELEQAVGVQLKHFQTAALEQWVQEYRGDLGVALTDVVGMDAFLDNFDLYFAKLFDGLRHDSGDPIEWGEKALRHYDRLRIDARTKRLVFSDGLDVATAIRIYEHFGDRVPCGFGIGTWLTNDLGPKPLNIVMKLVECNGQPVAKLSDSPGKNLCKDETFLAYLRQVFGRPA